MEVHEQVYSPALWDSRALPVDADGQPLDREHGLTFDSIHKLGHKQFNNPDHSGKSYKSDEQIQKEAEEAAQAAQVPQQGGLQKV